MEIHIMIQPIPGINYWLKSELLKTTEVGEYAQFWLGAYSTVRTNVNMHIVILNIVKLNVLVET